MKVHTHAIKLSVLLCLAVVLAILGGCSSKSAHMQVAQAPATGGLSGDKAGIVFYRPYSGSTQAPVAEFINDDVNHVAILSAHAKFFHLTTPGRHVYIVAGETGSLLEAELEGGKIYYVRIEPRQGRFKSRFAFVPIVPKDMEATYTKTVRDRSGDEERVVVNEKGLLDSCLWYENGPSAEVWFKANKGSMALKFFAAQEKFDNEKPEDRAVIRPEFGFEAMVD